MSLAGNSYYLVDLGPPASKPPINKMGGERGATSSLVRMVITTFRAVMITTTSMV